MKRLITAYEQMTMPDDCAQRIELRLQKEMKNRSSGRYTKMMTPESPQGRNWRTAALALCLLLVLVMGSMIATRELQPAELAATVLPETRETAWDHYAQVTDYSVENVENTAMFIRKYILEKDWEALRRMVNFKVTVQGEEVTDWQTFVYWMEIYALNPDLRARLEQEDCRAMFCNWQGISMADGLIWINQESEGLRITAVNMEIQQEPEDDDRQKRVPENFAAVLSGGAVKFTEYAEDVGLDEFCAGLWGDVTLERFAVLDMDDDGICEVVVQVQTGDAKVPAHLVLRQTGSQISGYSFQPGEMLDLKKDGTFFRRDRDYRLIFNDKTSWVTMEVKNNSEKPLAQWHAWPCLQPELLLRSYEYVTGTGWTQMPGNPYYYFQSIARKTGDNDVRTLQYWGMDSFAIEEDKVYLFDPDAPGTVLYGTLTEENGRQQFAQMGFYMSTEEREYMAEVRNMLSEEPEYWVDVHLPQQENKAGKVSIPEEMIAYFGYTSVPEEKALQENYAIWELMDSFAASYFAGDTEAIRSYLTEDYRGSIEIYSGNGIPELESYGRAPDAVMEVGEIFQTGFTVWVSGAYEGVNLELVKQEDGWKIQRYYKTQ